MRDKTINVAAIVFTLLQLGMKAAEEEPKDGLKSQDESS